MKEIEPILLTSSGNTLVTKFGLTGWSDDITDDCRLSDASYVGIHEICDGFIDVRCCNKDHRALYCRSCGLRIEVPNHIDTYGKLRQWCAKQIAQRREFASKIESIGQPFRWAPASVFDQGDFD